MAKRRKGASHWMAGYRPIDAQAAGQLGARPHISESADRPTAPFLDRSRWEQTQDRATNLIGKLSRVDGEADGRRVQMALLDLERLAGDTQLYIPHHFAELCALVSETLSKAGLSPTIRAAMERIFPISPKGAPASARSRRSKAPAQVAESPRDEPAGTQRESIKTVVRDLEEVWHRIQRIIEKEETKLSNLEQGSSGGLANTLVARRIQAGLELLERAGETVNALAADLDSEVD